MKSTSTDGGNWGKVFFELFDECIAKLGRWQRSHRVNLMAIKLLKRFSECGRCLFLSEMRGLLDFYKYYTM